MNTFSLECIITLYPYHKRPHVQSSHPNPPSRITLVKALPPNIAPSDNPTFVMTLTATMRYCLLSIRFEVSSANDDIVVNPPQNPIAISNAYFSSRFHC